MLGTVPGWITATGMSAVVIAYWRHRTDNRRLTIGDDQQRRGEKREELGDCNRRLDEVNRRVDALEAQSHAFQIKLTMAMAAYRIVELAHEAVMPGSLAVTQARAVLATGVDLSELPPDIKDLLRRADQQETNT